MFFKDQDFQIVDQWHSLQTHRFDVRKIRKMAPIFAIIAGPTFAADAIFHTIRYRTDSLSNSIKRREIKTVRSKWVTNAIRMKIISSLEFGNSIWKLPGFCVQYRVVTYAHLPFMTAHNQFDDHMHGGEFSVHFQSFASLASTFMQFRLIGRFAQIKRTQSSHFSLIRVGMGRSMLLLIACFTDISLWWQRCSNRFVPHCAIKKLKNMLAWNASAVDLITFCIFVHKHTSNNNYSSGGGFALTCASAFAFVVKHARCLHCVHSICIFFSSSIDMHTVSGNMYPDVCACHFTRFRSTWDDYFPFMWQDNFVSIWIFATFLVCQKEIKNEAK